LAGFQVTLNGRFWVTPEAIATSQMKLFVLGRQRAMGLHETLHPDTNLRLGYKMISDGNPPDQESCRAGSR
jgi:hypothetical protein